MAFCDEEICKNWADSEFWPYSVLQNKRPPILFFTPVQQKVLIITLMSNHNTWKCFYVLRFVVATKRGPVYVMNELNSHISFWKCLGLVFEKRVNTLKNFKRNSFKIDIDLTLLRLRLRGPDFPEENVKTFENALATFQRRLHFKTQRLFHNSINVGIFRFFIPYL